MQRPDRVATETLPFKVFFTFKIILKVRNNSSNVKNTPPVETMNSKRRTKQYYP